MTTPALLSRVFALTLASAMLAACGGGDGGSEPRTGVLKVSVTDAAVDEADFVWVRFSGVELKPKGGPAFAIDIVDPAAVPADTRTINLLDFQGTDSATLIPDTEVPAGEYEWIRLMVDAEPGVQDSYIVIRGAECELRIPSGAETGLKLVRGFTIGVGATTDFTIDFDLRKSITQPPGQGSAAPACDGQPYTLKPALRVVDNLEVGTIAGTVDPTLVAQQCPTGELGNVYLFGPYETTPPLPDDLDLDDADGADPITSAMVALDASSNNAYTIGFVPAGQYLVAYTCDADAPDVNEVVSFTPEAGTTATVTAGQTTTVDFGVPVP